MASITWYCSYKMYIYKSTSKMLMNMLNWPKLTSVAISISTFSAILAEFICWVSFCAYRFKSLNVIAFYISWFASVAWYYIAFPTVFEWAFSSGIESEFLVESRIFTCSSYTATVKSVSCSLKSFIAIYKWGFVNLWK